MHRDRRHAAGTRQERPLARFVLRWFFLLGDDHGVGAGDLTRDVREADMNGIAGQR